MEANQAYYIQVFYKKVLLMVFGTVVATRRKLQEYKPVN